MNLLARRTLLAAPCATSEPVVLLEGGWPAEDATPARLALDGMFDARFLSVDEAAARWAERLARKHPLARLAALRLRYYLVKLFRVAACMQRLIPAGEQTWHAILQRDRDVDYAWVLGQLAACRGARLDVTWRDADSPRPVSSSVATEGAVVEHSKARRWAGRIAEAWDRWVRPLREDSPRVVCCGSPRLLQPVAWELRRRGAQAWWLAERFAWRRAWAWERAGIGQLNCHGGLAAADEAIHIGPLGPVTYAGIDVGPAVELWLARHTLNDGPRWRRAGAEIARHFRVVRPTHVVLDEDQTPFARLVVGAARRAGARSWVVQHGAPGVSFGFAPLEADRVAVWGESSRRQLVAWGVSDYQIAVTGSPTHDALRTTQDAQRGSAAGPLSVLVLLPPPPRASRPEPAIVGLTEASHAATLDMILSELSALAARTEAGLRVVVRPHPRAGRDPALDAALSAHKSLRARVDRGATLCEALDHADLAVSYLSSSGIDARVRGLPVVQVLPAGAASSLLPAEEWGFLGSARTSEELGGLLQRAAEETSPGGSAERSTVPRDVSWSAAGTTAAARIVDALWHDCPAAPAVPQALATRGIE